MTNPRNKDFFSGILVAIIGLFFFFGAFDYHLGTLQRMGSGMFPLGLGAILTALGLTLAATSYRLGPVRGEEISWRALLAVGASIAAFALAFKYSGLLPAVAATIAVAALGDPAVRPRDAALMVLLYVSMAYLIFILGLGLPMPAFRVH